MGNANKYSNVVRPLAIVAIAGAIIFGVYLLSGAEVAEDQNKETEITEYKEQMEEVEMNTFGTETKTRTFAIPDTYNINALRSAEESEPQHWDEDTLVENIYRVSRYTKNKETGMYEVYLLDVMDCYMLTFDELVEGLWECRFSDIDRGEAEDGYKYVSCKFITASVIEWAFDNGCDYTVFATEDHVMPCICYNDSWYAFNWGENPTFAIVDLLTVGKGDGLDGARIFATYDGVGWIEE